MRVLMALAGLFLVVGAVVVHLFALLPADAPENATEVLALVGFSGVALVGLAVGDA